MLEMESKFVVARGEGCWGRAWSLVCRDGTVQDLACGGGYENLFILSSHTELHRHTHNTHENMQSW